MIEFDEVLEFDKELYKDNIARHEFSDHDELDGKGPVDANI